jgi:hypothetical protein
MRHQLEHLFPNLRVYVPAVPSGQRLEEGVVGLFDLDGETAARVAQVAAEAKALVEHFGAEVVMIRELPSLLSPLRQSLLALLAQVNGDYSALMARATDESSAEVVRWQLPDGPAERQDGYIVCDRYFRFVRVRELPLRAWLGSLALVALAVVEDLPHTLLNWDEMVALLKGMAVYFAAFGPAGDVAARAGSERTAEWPLPWQSEVETAGRTVAIAYFRLLVGHHWWQQLTILAREYFERSAAAFAAGEDDEAAHWLQQATWLFRSTTACMWFASIFPQHTYQAELRPTMVETDSVDAQQQHLSYNLLKEGIRQLKRSLEERTTPLSGLAFKAVKEFYEVYLQDMEQHILIASSKVGMDASLAQKVWQRDLPPNLRTKNAMDLLRDMAGMRQKEWQKVLNAKT